MIFLSVKVTITNTEEEWKSVTLTEITHQVALILVTAATGGKADGEFTRKSFILSHCSILTHQWRPQV